MGLLCEANRSHRKSAAAAGTDLLDSDARGPRNGTAEPTRTRNPSHWQIQLHHHPSCFCPGVLSASLRSQSDPIPLPRTGGKLLLGLPKSPGTRSRARHGQLAGPAAATEQNEYGLRITDYRGISIKQPKFIVFAAARAFRSETLLASSTPDNYLWDTFLDHVPRPPPPPRPQRPPGARAWRGVLPASESPPAAPGPPHTE